MSAFDPKRTSKAQSLIEAQEHGPGARSKSLANPKTGLAKSKIRKIEERHRQCKELWSGHSTRDPVGTLSVILDGSRACFGSDAYMITLESFPPYETC
jgi:hypothetical protein